MTRTPTVAGVAGGVGVSMLASALRAGDLGVYAGGSVDVLVCRTSVVSLGLAHEVAARTPYPPVLAVVADIPSTIPAPVRARMRMAEPHVHRLVAVPFVPEWRSRTDPSVDAAQVLLAPPSQVPRPLREFAKAMQRLVAALEGPLSTPQAVESPRPWDGQPEHELLTHQSSSPNSSTHLI